MSSYTLKRLKKILREHGYEDQAPKRGSHYKFCKKGKRPVIVAKHGKELTKVTFESTLKQAGLKDAILRKNKRK